MGEVKHIPVMLQEVLYYLNLAPGKIIVDATVGTGGHSEKIIERVLPGGRVICIDRDEEILKIAQERLSPFGDTVRFIYGNFEDLDGILQGCSISRVDGILFDLGVSSYHLESPERGFSFQLEGPLDMRLDRKSFISAYDLVNNLNEDEIKALLRNFGQERYAGRIARMLVKERQLHPIETTRQLSEIVTRAVPVKYRHYRIHPATRTFQAVRIAVNRELESLQMALEKAVSIMNRGGRLCVISFHSLEDRQAKLIFRRSASLGLVKIVTPKPIYPKDEEVAINPRSRSAKLRVIERL